MRHTDTVRHTDTQTHRHTDTETLRHTHTDTQRHTPTQTVTDCCVSAASQCQCVTDTHYDTYTMIMIVLKVF